MDIPTHNPTPNVSWHSYSDPQYEISPTILQQFWHASVQGDDPTLFDISLLVYNIL